MNYITSCPACETQFLLTKDHLKAYRGKVQCGHCNHVFNAKNRLAEVSEEVHDATHGAVADQTSEQEANSEIAVSAIEGIEPTHSLDEKPISQVLNVVLETVPNLSDLSAENGLSHHQQTSNSSISPQITESIDEENVDIDTIRAPIFIDDLTTDPKFKLTKPKRNFLIISLVLLLIVLAVLQSIYFLRTTIAAHYPLAKPYLEQACTHLNCKINLPQDLDLLTIYDSDMQENDDYQNVINFSSSLINNASYVQAYPNIELTLTDIEDKPVLRKLVSPQEYLKNHLDVTKGLVAGEEVRINLAINVQNLAVAGYRVLLTY